MTIQAQQPFYHSTSKEGVDQRPVVAFDVGGVIVPNPGNKKERIKYLRDELNIDTKTAKTVLSKIKGLKEDEKNGVQVKAGGKSIKISNKTIKKLNEIKNKVNPDKEVLEIINKIKKAGFRTAILSNVSKTGARRNEKAGIYDHEIVVLSCDVKIEKPDSGIYKELIKQLNLKDPSQIIFFDDKQRNIDTANRLGISGVQFTSAKQLRRELEKRGVLSPEMAHMLFGSPDAKDLPSPPDVSLYSKTLDVMLTGMGFLGKGVDKISDSLGSGLRSIKTAFHKNIKVILASEIIRTGLKRLTQSQNLDDRCTILLDTLTKVEEKGVKNISKKIAIGKESQLDAKIFDLRTRIANKEEKACQEAEQVLSTLRSRSIKMWALSLIQAVTSTIAIAAIIFSTIVAATPTVLSVGIISAGMAALSFGAEYFSVNQNPFDPNARSRLRRIVDFCV